ncbi:MAG: hypothetical protein IJI83_04815, partial [Oscillospiraceae bacterium]|nr:hypothetical protein [Oscillospiraceae bacterium]
DELAVQYDELLMKRAELGVQRIQVISLLELVDSIEGRVTLDMAVARQSNPAACYDTDDFIRRTSKRYGSDALDHFDDDLTRRFVEKVVVKDDSITVRFKAGIEVTI